MDFDVQGDPATGLYAVTVDGLCYVLDKIEADLFLARMAEIMQVWAAPSAGHVLLALYQATGRDPRN